MSRVLCKSSLGGPARVHRTPPLPTCDAGGVSNYRVRFEGPAALTLGVATALADADGIELVSSEQPEVLDAQTVALNVTVNGAFDALADAVASIRAQMPPDVSIEIGGR